MPTSIYSMLGIQGLFWGIFLLFQRDGSVPIWVNVVLIVFGVLMFVVWHRAWERKKRR